MKWKQCDRLWFQGQAHLFRVPLRWPNFLLHLTPRVPRPPVKSCSVCMSGCVVECLPPGWGSLVISSISPLHLSPHPFLFSLLMWRKRQRSAYIHTWVRIKITFPRGESSVTSPERSQGNVDRYSDRKSTAHGDRLLCSSPGCSLPASHLPRMENTQSRHCL